MASARTIAMTLGRTGMMHLDSLYTIYTLDRCRRAWPFRKTYLLYLPLHQSFSTWAFLQRTVRPAAEHSLQEPRVCRVCPGRCCF